MARARRDKSTRINPATPNVPGWRARSRLMGAAQELFLVLPGLWNHERSIARGYLTIGFGTYGRPRVIHFPGDPSLVQIGKYCSISSDVEFLPGGGHRLDWISTSPMRAIFCLPGADQDGHAVTKGNIIVGNDVWIGMHSRILSGVTIGDGATIGAASVVASDVPPYAIVAGSPAREIRRRFDDQTIASLLKIAWWDWSFETIQANIDILQSDRIKDFITRFSTYPTGEHAPIPSDSPNLGIYPSNRSIPTDHVQRNPSLRRQLSHWANTVGTNRATPSLSLLGILKTHFTKASSGKSRAHS